MHNRYPPHLPPPPLAGGNVQDVVVKVFGTLAEVAPAVASGSVDMVFGLDTIGPKEFKALQQQVGGVGCVFHPLLWSNAAPL